MKLPLPFRLIAIAILLTFFLKETGQAVQEK